MLLLRAALRPDAVEMQQKRRVRIEKGWEQDLGACVGCLGAGAAGVFGDKREGSARRTEVGDAAFLVFDPRSSGIGSGPKRRARNLASPRRTRSLSKIAHLSIPLGKRTSESAIAS